MYQLQKVYVVDSLYTQSYVKTLTHSICKLINQRTNGPVNAHLRSAVYTNVIENSPV